MAILLVVSLNLLIAGIGFYGAWRLWRWRQQLTTLTTNLVQWEQTAQLALSADRAPHQLMQSQRSLAAVRQGYRLLDSQVQMLRQVLLITSTATLMVQRMRRKPLLSRRR